MEQKRCFDVFWNLFSVKIKNYIFDLISAFSFDFFQICLRKQIWQNWSRLRVNSFEQQALVNELCNVTKIRLVLRMTSATRQHFNDYLLWIIRDELLNAHDSFAPFLWPTSSGPCSIIRLNLSQGSVCAGLLRNSSSQAIGIEAGISLRLLTDVVLYIEFRVVRVVAFPRLQVSEIK